MQFTKLSNKLITAITAITTGTFIVSYADDYDAVIVLADAESDSELNITDTEISNLEAATLEDLFQNTPSVTVNGGRAQAQQIFVNGLESTLSNVTIDGAPQGNLYHHSANVFVEPELLKKVGINAGAGSALDGPGALNGAIRFETKDAYDFLGDDNFYGLTKGIYYNNGDGFKFSQTVASRLDENWAVLLSGGYTDVDDYEDGNGDTVDLTAYDSRNSLIKLSGDYDQFSVDFGFEHVFSNTLSFDRTNVSEQFLLDSGRPAGTLQDAEFERNTFSIGFETAEGSDFLFIESDHITRQKSFDMHK